MARKPKAMGGAGALECRNTPSLPCLKRERQCHGWDGVWAAVVADAVFQAGD